MPNYKYTARNERGDPVTGTLAAPSQEVLADQLKSKGYLITTFKEVAQRPELPALLRRARSVKSSEMVMFYVQLARMMRAGIPLVSALNTLCQESEGDNLREILRETAHQIESGSTFSEALSRHPSVFSELSVSMVRMGEATGKLDEVLKRLADFAKRQAELRQQLQTGMVYPIILLLVGAAVMVYLVMGIIPKFIAIFLDAGVPLPGPTQLLYVLSQLMREYWLGLLAGVSGAVVMASGYARTPPGRRLLDSTLLKMPVIGDFVRKTALARLTRTLETSLSSGVPMLEALHIAQATCGNVVLGDLVQRAERSVQQGQGLAESLKMSAEFPPMMLQLISVGESSGTLDTMLAEIADHYDEMVSHGLKRLLALVEPIFLLVIGGLVAFIMASMLLPLFDMTRAIRR